MEFTVERTLRRRGRQFFVVGTILMAGALVWLAAIAPNGRVTSGNDAGDSWMAALFVLFMSVVAALRGLHDLRKAKRPFRLRIDGFGITLHDAELAWEQIDAVSLWHVSNAGENVDEHIAPPKVRLALWTAPGVTLPRKADISWGDDRTRYTLVHCRDLDQSVAELTTALAEYAGARFETAPRSVRPPIPVTVSGPERSVPGGEQVFVDARQAGTWTLVWAAAAVVLAYSFWQLISSLTSGLGSLVAICALFGAVACLPLAGRSLFRWLRPLRLRIGPSGIGMRQVTEDEQYFRWAQIAAVSVGPLYPGSKDTRPWLVVWPLPGTALDLPHSYLLDGHQAYALVRLDRLPGGPDAVVPVIRAYAGERYAETA
ncbi:hypothetical protein ACIP98_31565 [Streptomyces sp. NPDC088354]|uniref:hypothetical protein n=1 Tax=unclassified Streptomyces TaxID=2593676 RepID=UPI0029BD4FB0|nr:hypothetical protein [Streptomyces sp. MI02-7b]MDX3075399.1 hypothetical protein [Streptomyces sp. MI02-7b]